MREQRHVFDGKPIRFGVCKEIFQMIMPHKMTRNAGFRNQGPSNQGRSNLVLASAAALLLLTCGCRIDVQKGENGKDKNVRIDTPLGGIHVNQDAVSAADTGLPQYPGAHLDTDHQGDKSADIHMGFGDWQLRIKVVRYRTSDSQDKVLAFYKKALGRYGDVIECNGKSPVGSPVSTREGLTCNDDGGGDTKLHVDTGDTGGGHDLKAGSKRHQHIVGIDKESDADTTRFSLVQLDLPADSGSSDQTN